MAIELTPRAGHIITQVAMDRRASGVSVAPEHLLRALANDPVGVAGQILHRRGVAHEVLSDLEKMAAEARMHPESSKTDGTATAPTAKARTRALLERAEAEARRLGSDVVGTEHLLIALVKDEDGVAGQILRRWGITDIEDDIDTLPSESTPPDVGVTISLTPGTQGILEQAEAEARRLGSDVLRTEHLLIALVKDEDSPAGRILRRRGVTPGMETDIEEAVAPREVAAFPGRPQPWGSGVEHDQDGNALMNADGSLRQYLIDREGLPLLDEQGRRLYWRPDPNGRVVVDEAGNPLMFPID